MKKYFVTGLIILLPLTFTLAIVIFLFNLLTTPFLGLVKELFLHYHLFESGFLFFTSNQIQHLIARLLIIIFLFLFACGLGLIGRWFFFHTFIKFTDYIVKKIPLVSSIYKTCQEVIKTIFTTSTKSFKQVVLIRFPNPETYSLGLITREHLPGLENTSHASAIAVFVPTTPNPTSGFLVMYKPQDVIYLDMKVEEAFKYIISCGVITPPFNVLKPDAIKNAIDPLTGN